MPGEKFGYRRVSSVGQSLERQNFDDLGLWKSFEDKISGATRARPALDELLQTVREGDEVYVHSIDRLARSMRDLGAISEDLLGRGVSLHFLKENVSLYPEGDPRKDVYSGVVFSVFSMVAEVERILIRERQLEGIVRAKARGVYQGRGQSIDREKVRDYLTSGATVTAIAKKMKISRRSVYRIRDELGIAPVKLKNL
ncbi:hypothetical protein DC366_11130 [Pelagivirga sediminicola]|uniref:Resolvase/invertase-type recombinase catalytic domain-containing protein n=1 Tax=Pelagivirga sediminicola TaxID=2170575 RepID=A0A2T7G6X9_9RHOB|nr:recombinase family protein [Pelagivirga sediminicola]PVA10190.1 hypothetical protein DC366_11130 [Pelagivirga sediminicola]